MKYFLLVFIGLFSLNSLSAQSFHVEVGSGISMSDGVLGYGIFVEPHYTLTDRTSIGFEFSHKDFKWLGDTGIKHKTISYVLVFQLRGTSRIAIPYFNARIGYYNLYNLGDHSGSEYDTIGGGFSSGVYISIINIGMELNFYKENRPIEGSGGIFIKVRF